MLVYPDFWTNKKDLYTKVFERTWNAKTRFVLSKGGSGSSKSYSEAQKEIIKSFDTYGGNLLIVRQTYDSLRDSCFALLKGIISDWQLNEYFNITKSPMSIENKMSGKRFIFRGLDDIEKVKSIAGCQRCWIEEASETEFATFRELNRRIRGYKDIQITLLLNPVSEEHWIKKHFIDGQYADKTTVIHSTYKDNKFVGKEYGEELEKLKDIDENDYKVYCLGDWGVASEGLVFKGWRSIAEFPRHLKHWYGTDFGFTNDPTAIVRTAIDRKRKEIYLHEVAYETGMDNNDIAKAIKTDTITMYQCLYELDDKLVYSENQQIHVNDDSIMVQECWEDNQLLVNILKKHNFAIKDIKDICESVNDLKKVKEPIYCDSAEPKSIAELRKLRLNAYPCIKGKDSIRLGISCFKPYKVFYTRSSKNINKEINSYSWVYDKKQDKFTNMPEDKNNHIIDSGRYSVYTYLKVNGII